MRTRPEGIGERDLAAASSWGLDLAALSGEPVSSVSPSATAWRCSRDLWMLNGSQSSLACYGESAGRVTDGAAISCYRLAWAFTDLTSFTGVLRAPHRRDADTAKAWQAVKGTLHPGSQPGTSPFGRLPP